MEDNQEILQQEKTYGKNFWRIEDQHVIAIPSLSFDCEELQTVRGVSHYEERLLYMLFALRYVLS